VVNRSLLPKQEGKNIMTITWKTRLIDSSLGLGCASLVLLFCAAYSPTQSTNNMNYGISSPNITQSLSQWNTAHMDMNEFRSAMESVGSSQQGLLTQAAKNALFASAVKNQESISPALRHPTQPVTSQQAGEPIKTGQPIVHIDNVISSGVITEPPIVHLDHVIPSGVMIQSLNPPNMDNMVSFQVSQNDLKPIHHVLDGRNILGILISGAVIGWRIGGWIRRKKPSRPLKSLPSSPESLSSETPKILTDDTQPSVSFAQAMAHMLHPDM
jgi:hypothetical protein